MLGGALADPVDWGVLLFSAPSKDLVEAFARADPYVTGGLVTDWTVRDLDHRGWRGRRKSAPARTCNPAAIRLLYFIGPGLAGRNESLTPPAFLCTMRVLYSRVDSVPCSRTITARRVAPLSFVCCATRRCAASRNSCAC